MGSVQFFTGGNGSSPLPSTVTFDGAGNMTVTADFTVKGSHQLIVDTDNSNYYPILMDSINGIQLGSPHNPTGFLFNLFPPSVIQPVIPGLWPDIGNSVLKISFDGVTWLTIQAI